MERTDADVDAYLGELGSEDVTTLDAHIADIFAGEERVLWRGVFWGGTEQRIIGYGDWTYRRPGKPDVRWFMVGLAQQKNHISVYIMAVEDGQYAVKKYADTFASGTGAKPKVGSSVVSFKRLSDVDLAALLNVVRIGRSQLDG
jgi:hypothetical protein